MAAKADPEAAAAAAGEHDDELDTSGVPLGWRECPPMGRPIERFIPMKVPLSARFEPFIPEEQRFTIDQAVHMAKQLVAGRTYEVMVMPPEGAVGPDGQPLPPEPQLQAIPMEVALVIDLTKGARYYDPSRWLELGVRYIKVGAHAGAAGYYWLLLCDERVACLSGELRLGT